MENHRQQQGSKEHLLLFPLNQFSPFRRKQQVSERSSSSSHATKLKNFSLTTSGYKKKRGLRLKMVFRPPPVPPSHPARPHFQDVFLSPGRLSWLSWQENFHLPKITREGGGVSAEGLFPLISLFSLSPVLRHYNVEESSSQTVPMLLSYLSTCSGMHNCTCREPNRRQMGLKNVAWSSAAAAKPPPGCQPLLARGWKDRKNKHRRRQLPVVRVCVCERVCVGVGVCPLPVLDPRPPRPAGAEESLCVRERETTVDFTSCYRQNLLRDENLLLERTFLNQMLTKKLISSEKSQLWRSSVKLGQLFSSSFVVTKRQDSNWD